MIQYFSLPRISKSVAKGKRSFPVRGNINIIFRLSGTWPFRNYGTLLIVEGERFFSSFLVNFFLFFQLFSFGRRFYYIDDIFKIYAKYIQSIWYTYHDVLKDEKFFIRASSYFTASIRTVYLWNVLLLYKNLLSKSIVQETCDLMGERIGSTDLMTSG